MKYSQIEYYGSGLLMLMQSKLRLPGAIKLELIKLKRQLEEATSSVGEARIQLCQEYAEEDENGNPKMDNHSYVIRKEDMAEFNTRLKDLFNNEIELSIKKHTVVLPDMNDIEPQAIDTLLLIADSEDIF